MPSNNRNDDSAKSNDKTEPKSGRMPPQARILPVEGGANNDATKMNGLGRNSDNVNVFGSRTDNPSFHPMSDPSMSYYLSSLGARSVPIPPHVAPMPMHMPMHLNNNHPNAAINQHAFENSQRSEAMAQQLGLAPGGAVRGEHPSQASQMAYSAQLAQNYRAARGQLGGEARSVLDTVKTPVGRDVPNNEAINAAIISMQQRQQRQIPNATRGASMGPGITNRMVAAVPGKAAGQEHGIATSHPMHPPGRPAPMKPNAKHPPVAPTMKAMGSNLHPPPQNLQMANNKQLGNRLHGGAVGAVPPAPGRGNTGPPPGAPGANPGSFVGKAPPQFEYDPKLPTNPSRWINRQMPSNPTTTGNPNLNPSVYGSFPNYGNPSTNPATTYASYNHHTAPLAAGQNPHTNPPLNHGVTTAAAMAAASAKKGSTVNSVTTKPKATMSSKPNPNAKGLMATNPAGQKEAVKVTTPSNPSAPSQPVSLKKAKVAPTPSKSPPNVCKKAAPPSSKQPQIADPSPSVTSATAKDDNKQPGKTTDPKHSIPRITLNSIDFKYDPDKSLVDPNVVASVKDIIALLQIYGPLSYEQLKFNIATELEEEKNKNSSANVTGSTTGNARKECTKKEKLQQVLDILVELGVIHVVCDVNTTGSKVARKVQTTEESKQSKPKSGNVGANVESKPTASKNLVYCFGRGVPRMDVIFPHDLLGEIREAGNEVLRMQRRIEILKNALREGDVSAEEVEPLENDVSKQPSVNPEAEKGSVGRKADAATVPSNSRKRRRDEGMTPHKSARNTLKQLFDLHPEVVNDPVYAAAFRMFNVDLGKYSRDVVDSKSGVGSSGKTTKRLSVSSAASTGGGSAKKRKKGRPPKIAKSDSFGDTSERTARASPAAEITSAASWV